MVQQLWHHRWFVLGCCFLVLNVWAVFSSSGFWIQVATDSDKVSVTCSQKTGVPLAGKITPVWKFSHPMVNTNAIETWTEEAPVEIEPPIEGKFLWRDPSTLMFVPADVWPACQPYAFQVTADTKTLDGKDVPETRFNYPANSLRLTRAVCDSIERDRRSVLRLEFNAPVQPHDLLNHLHVSDGLRDLDFKILGQIADKVQLVNTVRVAHDKVNVSIDAGLTSPSGPAGLKDKISVKISLPKQLRFESIRPQTPSFADPTLQLRFSQRIINKDVHELIQVSPPVKDLEIQMQNYGYYQVVLRGDFKPHREYDIILKKGMMAVNGDELQEEEIRSVRIPGRPKRVQLEDRFGYLSHGSPMQIAFQTVNVNEATFRVHEVYRNNLGAFAARRATGRSYYGYPHRGISRQVTSHEVLLDAPLDEVREHVVDLKELLHGQKSGVYHIDIDAENSRDRMVIILTDLGLSVRRSGDDLLVWVNSLRTGQPVDGVKLRAVSSANQTIGNASTDTNGVARLTLHDPESEGLLMLVASSEEDQSILEFSAPHSGRRGGHVNAGEHEAFVFTERTFYRPGESIFAKAVVRGPHGEQPGETFPVTLKLLRPDGKEAIRRQVMLNREGTASAEFDMPMQADLGTYRVICAVPGSVLGSASLEIDEYVPPTIETTLSSGDVAENQFEFRVQVNQLFGGTPVGLDTEAAVSFRPREFHPGNAWEGYSFHDQLIEPPVLPSQKKLGKQKVGLNGVARFPVEFDPTWKLPASLLAICYGTAFEPNGRSVSKSHWKVLHLKPYYLGIQITKEAIDPDQEFEINLAAVSPEGGAIEEALPLRVELSRVTYTSVPAKNSSGQYFFRQERILKPEGKPVQLKTKKGRASVTQRLENTGRYLVRVLNEDETVTASREFSVANPSEAWKHAAPRPEEDFGAVKMKFDRERYRIGETAVLHIEAPFAGQALFTLEQNEVLEYRVLRLDKPTTELSIPVTADHVPNLQCHISVIRPATTEKIWKRHRSSGAINLPVELEDRRLAVEFETCELMEPNSTLEVDVLVRDVAGRPAADTELCVVAVDEGVLQLSPNWKVPDPHKYFYHIRRAGVVGNDLYAMLLADIHRPHARKLALGAGGQVNVQLGNFLNPFEARRVKSLALWQDRLRTDVAGRVQARFEIPEFSGRIRLYAVAVRGQQFGQAETAVTCRRDFTVRYGLPRFLAQGDDMVMPVLVYNNSESDGEISLNLNSESPLNVSHQSVLFVHGNSTTSVSVSVRADVQPGIGVFKLEANMNGKSMQEEVKISVRPPYPRVTLPGTLTLEPWKKARLPIDTAFVSNTEGYRLHIGGLPEIRFGGNLDYLRRYPYGCLEQTISSAYPLLALPDLAMALQPGMLKKEDLKSQVEHGIRRILSMQNASGGFGWWSGNSGTSPYISAYATEFLADAKAGGYDVPPSRLKSATTWLDRTLNNMNRMQESDKDPLRAYFCYVLARAGHPSRGWMRSLKEKREQLARLDKVHLALAYLAVSDRRAARAIVRERNFADMPANRRSTGGVFRSPTIENARLLQLWLQLDPDSPDIPKRVEELNKVAEKPYKYSTHENSLLLLAMAAYSKQKVAEIDGPLRGNLYLGENKVRMFEDNVDVELIQEEAKSVEIENNSDRMMYVHWTAEGVPTQRLEKDLDRQLTIRRRLFNDQGKPLAADAIEKGDLVVVQLELDTGGNTIDNIVIQDLLPAGLEFEPRTMRARYRAPIFEKTACRFSPRHVEDRDDRKLIFLPAFAGRGVYHYALRAVSEGQFIYPSISAHCMYDPELRSRHGEHVLRIGKAKLVLPVSQTEEKKVDKEKEQKKKTLPPIVSSAYVNAAAGIPGDSFKYIVVQGDTMRSISQAFITTEQELRRFNNLRPNQLLRVGQVLMIPPLR